MTASRIIAVVTLVLVILASGLVSRLALMSTEGAAAPGITAFVGARLFDGTGASPVANAVILVRDGKIDAVGPQSTIAIPAGAERVDIAGKFVVPGIINAHGHVGQTRGLDSRPDVYTAENIKAQLDLYARYGVTTVFSLGGDGPAALPFRSSQDDASLSRSRLFVGGAIVAGDTPEKAREMVREVLRFPADLVKIRVDDNLGTTPKMTPAVYQAVIDEAHRGSRRVAAHLFYLEDAKGLVEAGADLLAHSIRDQSVDAALVSAMKAKGTCLCPTLTREVSAFVYESTPDFFKDAFLLKDADAAVLAELESPARQKAVRNAAVYRRALDVASANLKKLHDAGVPIAFGTDTGPAGRFQGYFEHMELELMAKAGLSAKDVLLAATRDAARCWRVDDRLGTLEKGKWADFVVLGADPLTDVKNLRSIDSVWIAGNKVPERKTQS